MAHNSILLDKSLLFAARIVKLNKYLVKEKRETIISKQIIRSATSIGANANESLRDRYQLQKQVCAQTDLVLFRDKNIERC